MDWLFTNSSEFGQVLFFLSTMIASIVFFTHLILKKLNKKNLLERVVDKALKVEFINRNKTIIRKILFGIFILLGFYIIYESKWLSVLTIFALTTMTLGTTKEKEGYDDDDNDGILDFFLCWAIFWVSFFILAVLYNIWYYLCLGGMFLESKSISDFIFSIIAFISVFTLFGGLIAIAFGWDPWRRR